jgi:uncharacterized membrane protein
MRIHRLAGLSLALLAGTLQAGTFNEVGLPGGMLTGLSENGRIATGILGIESAWRWDMGRGSRLIAGARTVNGMSAWAQPIAGTMLDGNGDSVAAVFYSNSAIVGPVMVGAFPGTAGGFDGTVSVAYDASDDGTVVGLAYDETNNAIAFRWTQADGMSRLAVNRPGSYSRANAISSDGRVIAGWNDQVDGYRSGVIWIDGVPLDLVDDLGDPIGEALAVSPDGRVVVGTGYFGQEAWRWTAETGAQPIGFIGFFGEASGFAVSEDGNIVVGASGFGFNREAVVWTPATGMVLLADYLADQGVVVPAGWTLTTATAVSANGKVIAGWGVNGPDFASFLVDLNEDATQATVTAHGTVIGNDLPDGPLAGTPIGTSVRMDFVLTAQDALEIAPGQATSYRIVPGSFSLRAGQASETLAQTQSGPAVTLANDFPLSDGIHLFQSPAATAGHALTFELFNPGGDLFDADDLVRINRTFGPESFEKVAWNIETQGGGGLFIELQSISIHDRGDGLFADGFESSAGR